ncbi:hypothetical protein GQ44DRAFT_374118 [Phaeosphaeriaceae sp. PMI808]|nr:hypothetical protein GQ44DRAFT_374118 [Phaeosphaeriaceae sp. PMI808]
MLRAQIQARIVVEAMHNTLPQEICDFVYSYLIPRDTIQGSGRVRFPGDPPVVAHFCNCIPPPPLLSPPPPPPNLSILRAKRYPSTHVPPNFRIFDPAFISRDAAIAAVKLFYQNNTFRTLVTDRCSMHHLFLPDTLYVPETGKSLFVDLGASQGALGLQVLQISDFRSLRRGVPRIG